MANNEELRQAALKELAKRELARRGKPVESENPYGIVPGVMERAGQAISAPFRGLRGLGVGAQKLVQKAIPGGEDPTFEQVTGRAAEAVKPGFVPRKGERLGTFVGEAAPLLPLGAASIPAAAGLAGAQVGSEKLAETGSPTEAAKSAALAGGIAVGGGMAAKPALAVVKALGRNLLAAGKGLTKDVVDAYLDAGVLSRAKGKAGSVDAAVSRVKDAVASAREVAGERVARVRKTLGLEEVLEKTETKMLADEPRSVGEILQDANKYIETPSLEKQGIVEAVGLKEELRGLLKKSKAGDPRVMLGDPEEKVIGNKIKSLDNLINTTRGGRTLNRVNRIYADVLANMENFATQLKSPELSEEAILRVIKAGDKAVGRIASLRNSLKKVAGEKPLKEAAEEVAAKHFKGASGRGTADISRILMGVLTEGAESVIGAPGLRAVQKAAEAAAGAPGIVRSPGLTAALTQSLQRRGEE